MKDPLPQDVGPPPMSAPFQPDPKVAQAGYSPLPSEAGSSISNISTALTDLEAKILTELPLKLEAAFKGEHIARADRLQAKVAQLEEQLSQKSREEAAASSARDHLEKECEKWERQCNQMMQMLMAPRQVRPPHALMHCLCHACDSSRQEEEAVDDGATVAFGGNDGLLYEGASTQIYGGEYPQLLCNYHSDDGAAFYQVETMSNSSHGTVDFMKYDSN